MPNKLTNVLEGAKNVVKGWLPWVPDYNTAPPANRDLTVAYAPLNRKLADGTKVPVGSFLPEHFIIANAGTLKCQILEKEWIAERESKKLSITAAELKKDRPDLYKALYREDDSDVIRKTAFELAMCPSHKQHKIESYIEKEYLFRRDRDLPLPSMVSKYRVGPDYLKNIGDAGLELKEHPGNCKVNIINPTPTRREKIFHYLSQYASYLITISASVAAIEAMAGLGITAPWMLLVGVGVTYLAKKTGNDFGLYDVAEGLFRELGWVANKDFRKGKFSLFNAIGTGIYAVAIASAVVFAVLGTWGGTLALPWAFLAAKTGLGLGSMTVVAKAFAGLFAGISGLGALLGTTATIRYFWGVSIYDNQIAVDKKVADSLPVINTVKDFYTKQCDKLLAKLDKVKHGLTDEQRTERKEAIMADFKGLHKRFGEKPADVVVATSVVKAVPETRKSPRKSATK